MAKIWVKANCILRVIDSNGKNVSYHPGDWFEAGKHDARQWLATGQCEIVNPESHNRIIPPECGVVCTRRLDVSLKGLPVIFNDDPVLEYDKTLIWDPDLLLNKNLLPTGFILLDGWEIAVPISDYNLLAADIGTEAERQATKDIIHDLRVPVYDIRMIFIRKCIATERLIEQWEREKIMGGDDRLAFLRALYLTKPYILALPSIWCEK